jgi:hypothetical protein
LSDQVALKSCDGDAGIVKLSREGAWKSSEKMGCEASVRRKFGK